MVLAIGSNNGGGNGLELPRLFLNVHADNTTKLEARVLFMC